MVNYIGNQTEETGDILLFESAYVTRFQCPQGMTLTRLYVYLNMNNSSDKYRLGIYSDDSGVADAFLGQTDELTTVAGLSWQQGQLLSSVPLTSATWYWLGIIDDTAGSTLSIRMDLGGVPSFYHDMNTGITYPTWPNPFNGVQGPFNDELCIYGSDEGGIADPTGPFPMFLHE